MQQNVEQMALPVVLALALAAVPLLLIVPLWILLWCFVNWGYFLMACTKGWTLPKGSTRRILALLGFGGALLTLGLSPDREMFVSLLLVMAALKPYEFQGYRDRQITLFMAYIIAVFALYFRSSIESLILISFSIWCTTTILIKVNHPAISYRFSLKKAGLLLFKSLPLVIILFIVFPRLQGRLWGFTPSNVAYSGLSDRLLPGDVGRLVKNTEPVMRVFFPPQVVVPPEKMYFRGIVYWDFDGLVWRAGRKARDIETLPQGKNPFSVHYVLEPHFNRWLFALDLPVKRPTQGRLLDDYTIRSTEPVRQQIDYEVVSSTEYHTGEIKLREYRALVLPTSENIRAKKLGQSWASLGTPEQIINRALDYFRKNPFYYSLTPTTFEENIVDRFLFESRRGFCTHYATAFVFLMRAAGVPARVVGGYFGGEKNPYGNYYLVRQSDAHAWAEVWLENSGWKRVDPTSVIPPERVETLLSSAIAAAMGADQHYKIYGPLAGVVRAISQRWDSVNTLWHRWITGYSFNRQRFIMKKLGINISSLSQMFQLLAVVVVSILAILLAGVLIIPTVLKKSQDPVQKSYLLFCQRLEKRGLAKPPSMGPLDFFDLIQAHYPQDAARIEPIITTYVAIRYGGDKRPDMVKQFHTMVKRYTPIRK